MLQPMKTLRALVLTLPLTLAACAGSSSGITLAPIQCLF